MSTTDSSPLIGKIAALQNHKEFAEINWSGSFADYLEVVRQNPAVTRSAYQRVYDMILSYGQEEYLDNKKRLIALCTSSRTSNTAARTPSSGSTSRSCVWSACSRARPSATAPSAG